MMRVMTQRTGRVRIGEISAWLTERSRKLIPVTMESILDERSVIRREDAFQVLVYL